MERKGITIEIGVDTSKFDKKIKDINKEVRKTDAELRKIDKALKFNPTNVDLWRQKQQLLSQRIAETTDKLNQLKAKQAEMDAKGVDKNSEEYRKLQREIIETESKLKQFKSELTKLGSVSLKALGEQFKEIGRKMEEVGKTLTQKVTAPIVAAYGAATKASLDYGDAIAKMSTIADETQVPIDDLKKGIMDLSNQTGKSSTELAEAAYQALSASVETNEVLTFLEDASGLAKAGFLETADAVDVLTTIINAYGYEASDATKIANELIQTQNDGKTTVNELASAMGTVIPTASALNIPLEQLTASYVLMTKQGINTANATTYLNGMFTELADGGSDVSQILQNETGKTFGQLMKEGASLGDVLKILNESVDGDSEAFLNLWGNTRAGRGALSLLNGGIEEFNAEAETMANTSDNIGDALEKLDTTGAQARKALNMLVNVGIQVGDVLAPVILKVAQGVQTLLEKFNQLSPETQKIIVTVGAIIAAIGPALLIGGKILVLIGTIMTSISTVIGVIQGVGAAIGLLSSGALLPIIGVIGAVVAAGIYLYKNWDTIKAKAIAFKDAVLVAFNNMKNNITNTFNAIKTAIVTPIQTAIDKVKGLIDRIKGWFPIKLGKIFSGLKLPHFSLNWASKDFGKLGSIKYPTGFNVDWYAKGGIFDSPTVIGVGEAGSEAVVPLDKFWDKLDKMQGGETNIVININGANKDPREIAEEVKRVLIKETNNRRLAWQ